MRIRRISIVLLTVVLALFFCTRSASALTLIEDALQSVTAIVGSIPSIDPGGGGATTQSGVRFSGLAYPFATVTLQKGLEGIMTVTANANGVFSMVVPETTSNLFILFATDVQGRRSTLLNFPTVLYSGKLTDITGIRFAPTIIADKIALRQGDFITIEGAALPEQSVLLSVEGVEDKVFTAVANATGVYRITVPLTLPYGEYVIKTQYPEDTRSSAALRLIIGTASISRIEATANIPGDCNVDQRVTIVDFSVLAYWFGKRNPPACVDTNHDGVITLVDFSILAYYWTG